MEADDSWNGPTEEIISPTMVLLFQLYNPWSFLLVFERNVRNSSVHGFLFSVYYSGVTFGNY